jgi:O-antigen/teichoic acid export membrane protein
MTAFCAAAWAWAPVGEEMRAALLFGALMSPASSLIRISSSFANSRRLFNLSYVPDFLFRPGLLFCFLLAMLVMQVRPGLGAVMWVVVGSTWAVAIGQALVVGRTILPDSLKQGRHNLARLFRGRAAAMVLIATVVMAFADIVTLIGGAFLPAHEVAQLGVAIRLAALAGFVTQVTQNFVLPDLSEALVGGRRNAVRAIILRANVITMSAIGACVLVVVAAGPLILSIFGPDYQGARWALVMFMVSQLFRAAGGLNQHLLSLDGYQTRSVWACVGSVMLLIAASSLLAPRYGIEGVAVAVMLAEACWAVMLGIQAQRYAGYRGDIFANFRFHNEAAE